MDFETYNFEKVRGNKKKFIGSETSALPSVGVNVEGEILKIYF